jgi:aspartate aminotransferase
LQSTNLHHYYHLDLHLITSSSSSPPPLLQAALVALETVSESWMEERIVELKEKRDLALQLVRSIPGVQCPTPMGAFYIMPQVTRRAEERI